MTAVLLASMLAGCTASEWTSAHNGVLLVVLLALVAAMLTLVVRAYRRQRTIADDNDALVRRAQGGVGASARYIYEPGPPGRELEEGVFGWDDVDSGFRLGWKTGHLKGRRLAEMIPAGPDGDEARAAYARVLADREPAVYLRTEPGPSGALVTVRYSHAPMADGRGCCVAVALSPEIDDAFTERDEFRTRAETWRARAEAAEASARILSAETAMMRQQAFHERQNGVRTEAPGEVLSPSVSPA